MYNYTPQATTMQSLILIRRRGWSGRIASLPLFRVSFFFPSFLPSFLFFVFFGSPTTRTGGRIVTILRLVNVFCAKDVPFGVRIFNFYIFAYFSPKIERRTERRENLTQSWEREMQFWDAT